MSSINLKIESLGALAAFVHVAETGGFAAAARRAGQSPSTTAKAVARLEASLGVDLFIRTTRSVTLTDEGALLLEHAKRVLEDITSAESALAGLSAAPSGTLKVSVPIAFGESVLVPSLPDFLAAYPGLSVKLHLEDRMVGIAEEGFDAAVRIAPALSDSTLVARALGPHRLRVYGAPSYTGNRGTPTELSDLADHECIGFVPPGSVDCLPWLFQNNGQHARYLPKGRLSFNSNAAMMQSACAGMGLVALPEYFAANAVAHGELLKVLTRFSFDTGKVWILWPAAKRQSRKVRTFIDHVSERWSLVSEGLKESGNFLDPEN